MNHQIMNNIKFPVKKLKLAQQYEGL